MTDKPNPIAKAHRKYSSDRRTFLAGLGAAAGGAVLSGPTVSAKKGTPARNVVLVIPDGQSQSQVTAARYLKAYQDDPEAFPVNATPDETQLNVDRFDTMGTMTTMPDDVGETEWGGEYEGDFTGDELDNGFQNITDSAAAGTAMSTGTKTYNGAVGGVLDYDKGFVPVKTVLEKAREAGYATGLVTTTRLTHATPATFATHWPDRDHETEIARQYIEGPLWAEPDEEKVWVDVLLGGGGREFSDDLIDKAEDKYEYVTTQSDLEDVTEGPVLGLFSESHIPYTLDRGEETPSLSYMVEKAIELLRKKGPGKSQGFFLMVEAGRVDHKAHANDPSLPHEELEADEATGVALDYANSKGTQPTLVINAGDHETGGLQMGRDAYNVNMEFINEMEISLETLWPMVEDADNVEEVVTNNTPIESLTSEEISRIEDTKWYPNTQGFPSVVSEHANIGWGSCSHSGRELPIWASGPNAEYLAGANDNTDIYKAMAQALKL
ncbi:alkaline phosphatase [Halapricum desulfuricans]|uniref:Alkaline phosphatase n=1 Tax=Halapricum desulfuricans TaxID=2841257 RepID=A0A897NV29_9EURY|nr:alkaline phosphatase [Halapricum desulfuricans]QSG16294.1 Alkaline phosphatase [Halapricum desulfuricans]